MGLGRWNFVGGASLAKPLILTFDDSEEYIVEKIITALASKDIAKICRWEVILWENNNNFNQ